MPPTLSDLITARAIAAQQLQTLVDAKASKQELLFARKVIHSLSAQIKVKRAAQRKESSP